MQQLRLARAKHRHPRAGPARLFIARAAGSRGVAEAPPPLFIFFPEPGEGEVAAGEPDEGEGVAGEEWEVGGAAAGEVVGSRGGGGRRQSL